MARDYEHDMSAKFIYDLENGELKEILDIVKRNPSKFQIEFRKNYINVYYRGGNLFRIETDGYSYTLYFDKNYCFDPLYKEEIENRSKTDIALWIADLANMTNAMDEYITRKSSKSKEREYQQALTFANRGNEKEEFIIEVEYGLYRAYIDMLCVKWDEKIQKYRIYFVELKSDKDTLSSFTATKEPSIENLKSMLGTDESIMDRSSGRKGSGGLSSGLLKHYIDYCNRYKAYEEDIIKTISNSMRIRNKLGLSNFENIDSIERGLNIVFLIFNHNEKSAIFPREKEKISQLVNETGIKPIYKLYRTSTSKLDFNV